MHHHPLLSTFLVIPVVQVAAFVLQPTWYQPGSVVVVVVVDGTSSSTGSTRLAATSTRYEVCLSPGCMADGADNTLRKLQALAPPGDEVVKGVCCSLCGNGPIVGCLSDNNNNNNNNNNTKTTTTTTTTTKHRRVKGTKLLELLTQGNKSPISQRLVQTYELYEQANDALKNRDFPAAINLYGEAAKLGYQPAMELQEERKQTDGGNNKNDWDNAGIPVALVWLVDLRKNEAIARLQQGNDFEGARLAADEACALANNGQDVESLDVLVQVHQARGDCKAELNALTKLVALLDAKEPLSRQEQNKRRQLGFRRTKLEREVA